MYVFLVKLMMLVFFLSFIVVEDDYGVSKGYGFVRFSDEYERDCALEKMDGAYGLGLRPIRVKQAQAPKHKWDV